MQYMCHCGLIFSRPRSFSRASRLLCRILPNIRLHRVNALAVESSALRRINGTAHAFAGMVRVAGFGLEVGDWLCTRAVRILQALAASVARLAIRLLGGIQLVALACRGGVDAAKAGQRLACWANTGVVVLEAQVSGREALKGFGLPGGLFVVQRLIFGFVFSLAIEAFVAVSHLVVRYKAHRVSVAVGS